MEALLLTIIISLSVVGEKGWVANSRMGARICRDRYFEFFCLGSGDCGGGGSQQRFFFSVLLSGRLRAARTQTRIEPPCCPAVCSRLTSRSPLVQPLDVKAQQFHSSSCDLLFSLMNPSNAFVRISVAGRARTVRSTAEKKYNIPLCYRSRRNSVSRLALFTYPFTNETTSLSCLYRSVSKHKVFSQCLCYKKYTYICVYIIYIHIIN